MKTISNPTKVAQIDLKREKLVEQYKAGLITEPQLAYSMHMLSNKEERCYGMNAWDEDELYMREQMQLAIKKNRDAFIWGLAKARTRGLVRIHRKYVSPRWGILRAN